MKFKAILGGGIVIALMLGFFVGRQSVVKNPPLQLFFDYTGSPGIITAYTFYVSPSGEKIRHGWSHEVSTDMKLNVHVRYENGLIKEGGGKID